MSATVERSSLLGAVWTLEAPARGGAPIADVEALCLAAMRRRGIKRDNLELYDEILADLLGYVVIVSTKYDPDRGRAFEGFLFDRLVWRIPDFVRSFWGRNGERRVHDGASGDDRLAGALGGEPEDDPDSRLSTCGGLLAGGDRPASRPFSGLRVGAARGSSPRARRAGAQEGGRARDVALRADRGALWRDCPGCGWRHYSQAPNGIPGWHFDEACSACGELLNPSGRAGAGAASPGGPGGQRGDRARGSARPAKAGQL